MYRNIHYAFYESATHLQLRRQFRRVIHVVLD